MLPKIASIKPQEDYKLLVSFDGGKRVLYDVGEDIATIPAFEDFKKIRGLFQNARIDSSRTIVVWNDSLDLPSDTLYEYGKPLPTSPSTLRG